MKAGQLLVESGVGELCGVLLDIFGGIFGYAAGIEIRRHDTYVP